MVLYTPKHKHLGNYMTTLINNYTHHTLTKDGVVTNTKTGTVKSIWLAKTGYFCVDIHEDGKAKKHYLHRLLAESYIPNPENKRTVNHIDGNKQNNDLSNLEWASDSENISHAYQNNLNHCSTKKVTDQALEEILTLFLQGNSLTYLTAFYPFSLGTLSTYIGKYAENVGKAEEFKKAKEKQKNARASKALHKTYTVNMIDVNTGSVLNTFYSLKQAMEYLGKTTSGPISNVLSGRQKTAYGYFWERV